MALINNSRIIYHYTYYEENSVLRREKYPSIAHLRVKFANETRAGINTPVGT